MRVHGCVLGLLTLLGLVAPAARSRAQRLEAPPANTHADVSSWAEERHSGAVSQTVTGLGMMTLGVGFSMARNGSDAYVLSMVSVGGISAISGSFVMMHGAARLHVTRALARGTPLDVLQAAELRRGKRELRIGTGLVLGSGVVSCVGWFAGSGNIVGQGVMFGLAGAGGLSGVLLLEHAAYRVHFGRHGTGQRVAWVPSFAPMRDGGMLGVSGAF